MAYRKLRSLQRTEIQVVRKNQEHAQKKKCRQVHRVVKQAAERWKTKVINKIKSEGVR